MSSIQEKISGSNTDKIMTLEDTVAKGECNISKDISIKTSHDDTYESSINVVQMSIPARANQDCGNYWRISIIHSDIDGLKKKFIDHFLIAAVADGHGKYGAYYSRHCIDYLNRFLREQSLDWLYVDDLRKHLKDLFLMIENDCIKSYKGFRGGTTLSLCVRRDGRDIWIANVGDSDVILVNTKQRTYGRLSGDHSPTNIEEFKRILTTHPETIFEYDQLNRKKKKHSSKDITNTTKTSEANTKTEHFVQFDAHVQGNSKLDKKNDIQKQTHDNYPSPKKLKTNYSNSDVIRSYTSPSSGFSVSSYNSYNLPCSPTNNNEAENSVCEGSTIYSNETCLAQGDLNSRTNAFEINSEEKAPPKSTKEVPSESKDHPSNPELNSIFASENYIDLGLKSNSTTIYNETSIKTEMTSGSCNNYKSYVSQNRTPNNHIMMESASFMTNLGAKPLSVNSNNKMDLEILHINQTHPQKSKNGSISQAEDHNNFPEPENEKTNSTRSCSYIPIYGQNQFTKEWEQLPFPSNNPNIYFKNVHRELACYLNYRNMFRTSMTRSIGDVVYKKNIGCIAEPTISSFPDFLTINTSISTLDNQDYTVPMTPNVSFNDLTHVASFTSKTNEVLNLQKVSSALHTSKSFRNNNVHQYLILATDGYWDSCEFDDLVNFLQETEITIDGFSELEADTSNLRNNEKLEETLQTKRKMLLKRLAKKHVKDSFKYFGPLSDDAYVQILY